MRTLFIRITPFFILAGTISLLYGFWLKTPFFFDDIGYFVNAVSFDSLWTNWQPFMRRWVSTASLTLIGELANDHPVGYRIYSAILHILVFFSLYIFVRSQIDEEQSGAGVTSALASCLLLALHPISVFAVGYVVQESILLASLFSIWMWIAVDRGVRTRNVMWLALSIFFYYLAVCSKEHAVTVAGFAVLVAWNATNGEFRLALHRILMPLLGWGVIAFGILFTMRYAIGTGYEPLLQEMSAPQGQDFYARSVLNQAYLWFKYVLLWCVPYENWMGIDIRLPFPEYWYDTSAVIGFLAYIFYPIFILFLYKKKLASRLMVIGLLGPWILYLSQFSSVQYQESFVLYRSYLWVLPISIVIAIAFLKLRESARFFLCFILCVFLFGLSWGRLQTFSQPILIWDESVQRLQGNYKLPGVYRLLHNRGLEFARLGLNPEALADFDKVVELNPSYPYVYSDRGLIKGRLGRYEEAMADYDRAIALKPDYVNPLLGKSIAMYDMGRRDEAIRIMESLCTELHYGCPVLESAKAGLKVLRLQRSEEAIGVAIHAHKRVR